MRTRTLMMAWLGSAVVAGVVVVWAAGSAVAVVAAPQELASPLIASAQVSADQTTLTLTELNFANAENTAGASPSVSLALTPLPVTVSSPTLVTALLPSPLEAGTYLVLLQRSDAAAATFHVTVGAVGPPGPAGPESSAAIGAGGAIWQ